MEMFLWPRRELGIRKFCAGCGRLAPMRIQSLQKKAAEATAAKAGNGAANQSPAIAKRLADLEAENRHLRAAAGQSAEPAPAERPPLQRKTEEEESADREVAKLEQSLANLRKCTHPGREKQVEDLERHIAHVCGETRKTWSPPRARQRLVARLQDAEAALAKTSARQ